MVEKEVALGSVGALDLSFAHGKAQLAVKVDIPQAALGASLAVSIDSLVLIDKLFEAIESASPDGAKLIEEQVKVVLKAVVAGLG